MENLRKVLEDEDEDSQSPDNLNNTVLDMDETGNNDEILPALKRGFNFWKVWRKFFAVQFCLYDAKDAKLRPNQKARLWKNAHSYGNNSNISPGRSPNSGFNFGAQNSSTEALGTTNYAIQDKNTQPPHNLANRSVDKNQTEGGSSSPRFGIAPTTKEAKTTIN